MSGDAHTVLEQKEERPGCLLHMLTASDELGGQIRREECLLLSY